MTAQMKKQSDHKLSGLMMGFTLLLVISMLTFNSCGTKSDQSNKAEDSAKVEDDAFYETQPVHSGLYNADYYDIQGTNPRKGKFDGRIYFSLSPETSAFYVFENGNRTKIDYTVTLKHPFEKNDSGIYCSVDTKDRPVTVNTDSTTYFLDFQRQGEEVKIGFSPKARHTGTALEILEKMAAQKNKK